MNWHESIDYDEPTEPNELPNMDQREPEDNEIDWEWIAALAHRDGRIDDWENWDESPEGPACLQCGGEGKPLGSLGNRTHYRCRDCGFDFSIAN